MVENRVHLSTDRKELTITRDGHTATLRSARPDGFTRDDLLAARTVALNSGMVSGQVNRTRSFKVGQLTVFVSVNTGPPTWWYPRIQIGRTRIMAGWLRALVAVAVK